MASYDGNGAFTCNSWLEENDAYVGKRHERVDDTRLDVAPVQSAETASEWRDRDRVDSEHADTCDEIRESRLDVLELRRSPPVLLRREVDHETRRTRTQYDVHAPDHD